MAEVTYQEHDGYSSARVNGKLHELFTDEGNLKYYYNVDDKTWVVEEMHSNTKGGGKKLIGILVNKLGPGKKVLLECVIEKETRKRLQEVGVFNFVEGQEKKVVINYNPALFKTLKIARVAQGGGLKIERAEFEYMPEEIKPGDSYPDDISPKVHIDFYCTT